MDIAVVLIAVTALVASTASITLQLTIWKLGGGQRAAQTVSDPLNTSLPEYPKVTDLNTTPPTAEEIRIQQIAVQTELKQLDEMFGDNEQPFSGINEDFS